MDVKRYYSAHQMRELREGFVAPCGATGYVDAAAFYAVLKDRDALQGKLKVAVEALENIDCSANGPSAVSGHSKYNPWGIANYCIEQAGKALAQLDLPEKGKPTST